MTEFTGNESFEEFYIFSFYDFNLDFKSTIWKTHLRTLQFFKYCAHILFSSYLKITRFRIFQRKVVNINL